MISLSLKQASNFFPTHLGSSRSCLRLLHGHSNSNLQGHGLGLSCLLDTRGQSLLLILSSLHDVNHLPIRLLDRHHHHSLLRDKLSS